MSKTITKKRISKKSTSVQSPETLMYDVSVLMNGETYQSFTNNVRDFLESIKPELLFSEIYVTIKYKRDSEDEIIERKLNLVQGKRLFLDDVNMEIFINNLYL